MHLTTLSLSLVPLLRYIFNHIITRDNIRIKGFESDNNKNNYT